jgi:serine/threonine-protein kinase
VIDAVPLELADFGEYEKIEYIGHGGMGVVYRAYHKNLKCFVALKMSLPRHLSTAGDVARFRAEAQSMARLRHPNIIRVHEIEEYEGRPFFRMEFIEGTSLDRQSGRYGQDPKAAAELVVALARAVHHAHQRGVLHRDLKPANVLLDNDDMPYITDFGLARQLGQDVEFAATGLKAPNTGETLDTGSGLFQGIVGTAGFMSPEHANPESEETILSDVYGLGAILYAMLTGYPPNCGSTLQEAVKSMRDPEQHPVAPRTLNKNVDQDLEAVCLKCLEKNPESRYESALELAEDLERWRQGLQTRARSWNPMTRFTWWCRCHSAVAALLAVVAVAAVLAGLLWMESNNKRKLEQRKKDQQIVYQQALLKSTGHVARLVASVVRDRLDELARTVEQEACRPQLAALLAKGDASGLRAFIKQVAERYRGLATASPFETWAIFAPDGTMLAHSPDSDVVGTKFDFRDYFRGALEEGLAAGEPMAYVSHAYKSSTQGIFKFGITCVIRDSTGETRTVGLLLASVTTDKTMGLPQTIDSRYVPVLVAPRETRLESEDPSPVKEYIILFHPAYKHGADAVAFPARLARQFNEDALHDNYRDPVGDQTPAYAGHWLAGLASIPNTRFFIVVQARCNSSDSLTYE